MNKKIIMPAIGKLSAFFFLPMLVLLALVFYWINEIPNFIQFFIAYLFN